MTIAPNPWRAAGTIAAPPPLVKGEARVALPGTWIAIQIRGQDPHVGTYPGWILDSAIIGIERPGAGFLRLHLSSGDLMDVQDDGSITVPA